MEVEVEEDQAEQQLEVVVLFSQQWEVATLLLVVWAQVAAPVIYFRR